MKKDNMLCRVVALVLCFAMLVGFVPAGLLGGVTQVSAASTAPANLVQNGGFDDGTNNWSVMQQAQAKVEVVDNALKIAAAAVKDEDGNVVVDKDGNKLNQSATLLTQSFDTKAYDTFELKLKFKWLSGKQKPFVGVWFYKNAATTENCLRITKIDVKDTTGEWVDITVKAIAPAGATIARVQIGTNTNSVVSFLIDDVSLTKDDTTYAFAESFETFNKDEDGVAASKLGAEGWADSDTSDSAAVKIFSTNSYKNTYSLQLTAANVWAQSPEFDVEAGYAYTLSYMAKKLENNSFRTGYVQMIFLDAEGAVLKIKEATAGKTFTDWTEETVVTVAPEGAVKAYLLYGLDTILGQFAIDEIKVTKSEKTAGAEVESTDPPQEEQGTAEVFNGGFEQGLDGWNGSVQPGAKVAVVTEDAYSGQNALKLTAAASGTVQSTNTWYQTIGVGEMEAIQVSCMAKRLSGKSTIYLSLSFYDKDGNMIPDNTSYSTTIAKTEQWNNYRRIQAVPEGAVSVKVQFGNYSNAVTEYMVDDIKLEEYTGPASIIMPAYSGGASGENNVPAGPLDPSELNGSFEELYPNGEPVNWRLTSTGIFSVETPEDAPFGKNVMQLKTTGGGGVVQSASIVAEPGKAYEMKIMARDLENNCARICMYFFDAEGNRLDDQSVINIADGTGKWKMYTAVAVAPDNAKTVEAWIWYASRKVAAIQFDALVLQESDVAVKPIYVPEPATLPKVEELLENLSDEYPRIYFTAEEAKQIKLRRFNTSMTEYGFTWYEQYQQLLGLADAYMAATQVRVGMNSGEQMMFDIYPVLKDPADPSYLPIYIEKSYDENGNLYDIPYSGFGSSFQQTLRDIVQILSLSYIMTGKKAYAERAILFVEQMADWKAWGDEVWISGRGAKAQPCVAWAMTGVVTVYDMCYNVMTDAQREKIERSIIEKGIIPLSAEIKPMSLLNLDMMLVGGVISGCAAVLDEDNAEMLKPYLDIALNATHNALSNYAYSGNIEGHYYTDFGLESFLPALAFLYRATKLEGFIDHPFLTEILPYWTAMWAAPKGAAHPNYSDGRAVAHMHLPMALLSKVTDNPFADAFLISAGGTESVFQNFVYLDPDPQPEYPEGNVGYVEVYGYGALRTGFADDDMILSIKANDSQMSHNHFDQNSIQLNFGGTWLMGDPGAGSYYLSDRTFWTHNGHSTILVDGNSQFIKGTASLEKVFSSSLYGYLIGSAPRAYGGDYEADYLTKFDRHTIQVNHEDKPYYVIIDDLESTKDHVYSWQMYSAYNNGFSVDGEQISAEGTLLGNSVTMPMGKNVLNLNFIDGDKLSITDYIYKSMGQDVGKTLLASSAASKTHQFMTVIRAELNKNANYISFADMLRGRVFTATEREEEGDISWKSSMPIGQDCVKEVNIGTELAVFFRGIREGDYVKYPIIVEETGVYDVKLLMGRFDGGCQTRVYLDDQEFGVFDYSGMPHAVAETALGELELTAGEHILKLEVAGPGLSEDYSTGCFMIDVIALDMMRVDVQVEESEDFVVSEVYDTDEVLGGLINYAENKFDLLMFNRTEGAATAGKLNTDAKQASVLGLIDGVITEGFAATNATTLVYDGKVLFTSEKDVNIVADGDGWHITSAEAQNIKLTAIASEYDYVITVNGEQVNTKIENGELAITLVAGETDIAVVVDEPEPTEPSEPATEPSEPAAEPSEPSAPAQDGNDATVWIIVAVGVVLLAAAAAGLVIFLKKRKAE